MTIDARDSPHAMMCDLSRPVPVPATKVCFYVPFSGEKELFECRPSSFTMAYPCGRVQGNELLLEYTLRDHDAEAVRASFNRDLQAIKQYVEWITNDLAHLPARLEREARARIEARQAKLGRDAAMLDALGFPKRQ